METDASDFFAKAAQPVQPAAAESFDTPVMTPAMPTAQPESPAAAVTPEMPAVPIQPAVPAAPPGERRKRRCHARHTDEDGWISITSEPVEEKDISTLVAAAMEKPAASEQAAAAAPVDETEPVDTYQYQYPPIELFENRRTRPTPARRKS